MISVITNFSNQAIDELVLDLRYNQGGYVSTCVKLASMLVPSENLNDVFLTQQWNSLVTDYLETKPDAEDYFTINFSTPAVSLNLDRLIILCSGSTASASEAIVNGLKPYMDVILIGDKTSGKYTGVNLFYDQDEPPAHNWGVFLVINRIANADGVTEFVDGFTPDHVVDDNFITPHGDESEPLLAKALEIVTGTVTKSTQKFPEKYVSIGTSNDGSFEKDGIMILDNFKLPEK
jgi:C-terminal processing protease CtpA/Prc